MIDRVSGLFFIVGLFTWFARETKYRAYILIPLVLLPIPQLLPMHPPVEIPHSARIMAILPFVFFFVAHGITTSFEFLKKYIKNSTYVYQSLIVVCIVIITCINLFHYFVLYPEGLPNKNTPYGKIIASYIDTLPSNTRVFLTSYGWGEWGQPEPDGIYYALKNRVNKEGIRNFPLSNCAEVNDERPVLIVFSPIDYEKITMFAKCLPKGVIENHVANNQQVFTSLYLK